MHHEDTPHPLVAMAASFKKFDTLLTDVLLQEFENDEIAGVLLNMSAKTRTTLLYALTCATMEDTKDIETLSNGVRIELLKGAPELTPTEAQRIYHAAVFLTRNVLS